jgi:hypothetical protein
MGLLAILLGGLASSCADVGCNESYKCPGGQTCATKDGTSFSCVTSGPGAVEAVCDNSLAAGATCGDRLTCLQTSGFTNPRCVLFCEPDGTCPPERTCTAIRTTLGATLDLCVPCNISYACGANQTCATATGASFACVPSGAGRRGDACDATAATAVCGDRLLCLSADATADGTCVGWCDHAHPCPTGKTCKTLGTSMDVSIEVCQ